MESKRMITRNVKKFGKVICADNIDEFTLNNEFNKFIEEVRNKGYIPIEKPKLDKRHYHFTEKGFIYLYEDEDGNYLPREAMTDEHKFFIRAIYVGKRKANEKGYLDIKRRFHKCDNRICRKEDLCPKSKEILL